MSIGNEAVEAAARALIDPIRHYKLSWDELTPSDQWRYRQFAANALEAAAPHILRQAALELMAINEAESRMPGIRFAVGFLGGVKK